MNAPLQVANIKRLTKSSCENRINKYFYKSKDKFRFDSQKEGKNTALFKTLNKTDQ